LYANDGMPKCNEMKHKLFIEKQNINLCLILFHIKLKKKISNEQQIILN
jgi:hypothetical protein